MKLKVEIFKDENEIPLVVRSTLKTLHAAGFEAVLAGGCVRDALLGRRPKDFDIATDATPGQVEKLFDKTVAVGRDFGVMIVVAREENGTSVSIEVATFRNDGAYVDGRRPESVEFSSAKEDALRRDFTINGLFYDLKSGSVIDYVGGCEDLRAKTVRSIGEPRRRFTEDKLRIIRAVRFASELQFEIEDETLDVLTDMAPQLSVVSSERITEELNKMFAGSHPGSAMQMISSLELRNIIFNGFALFKNQDLFTLFKFSLGLIEKDSSLGWALLAFYEWRARGHSSQTLSEVMGLFSAFRLSRDLTRVIEFCLRNWDALHKFDTEALLTLDEPNGLSLFQLATLVNVAESTLFNQPLNAKFDSFLKRYNSLSGDGGRLEACWINGDDLASVGIPRGPAYKEILHDAYIMQLDRKVKSRDGLLKWLANQRQ